jgi:hypothetical protein
VSRRVPKGQRREWLIFRPCNGGYNCPSFRYVWLLAFFARQPGSGLHPAIARIVEALARSAARRGPAE